MVPIETARGYEGGGSPDRVDALVLGAGHELMIEPAARCADARGARVCERCGGGTGPSGRV